MSTRDMTYIALFTAIIGTLGLFPPIPVGFIPVPITLQTFGIMLAGSVLGARRGFLSVFLFILILAAGAPLMSGGRGGLAVFASPSGGFVIGYPLGALCIGILTDRFCNRLRFWNTALFNVIGGIGIIYLFGIPFMAVAMGLPIWSAVLTNMVFLPGDLVKSLAAAYVSIKVRKFVPNPYTVEGTRGF